VEIINKVSQSGLITIEMKSFKGSQKRTVIDIKKWLYEGIVLKEKLFRSHLKEAQWDNYKNHFVAIHCSEDTIVPIWAYMLITSYLKPYAENIILGDSKDLEAHVFCQNINQLNLSDYKDKRVLIKGCSDTYIPDTSFVHISELLINEVKSLMFGEACSNVPIFKRKN
jgi:hypothetical protein